jgi:hypothetical protein
MLSNENIITNLITEMENKGKEFIFINSLKNLYLPCFVDNMEPMDVLYCFIKKPKQYYFVTPTDKEGKTLVYYN